MTVAMINEILISIATLIGFGYPHPAWQTNPVLKHFAARIIIGLLAVGLYLGYSYYQADDADWNLAEATKNACFYLEKHPKGFHLDEAQKKCKPSNSVPVIVIEPPVAAVETKPAEEPAAQPAAEVETDEQKAEKMVLKANDYVRGANGRKKSISLACRWYKKAADLGNSDGIEAIQQPACQQHL